MRSHIYSPIEGEIFHVHTLRCKHAEDISDRAYIDKAVELGASRIVFTDHSPFPGNPFRNRMDIEQLPEYIKTLNQLKEEYSRKIEVLVGLEVEYVRSFKDYYVELRNTLGMDLLIIGQHFYEDEPGRYSFSNEDKSGEYIGLCEAMIEGIETDLFDAVAHPDRMFRRRKTFGEEENKASQELINAASSHNVYLEVNHSSAHRKHQFWKEFWDQLERKELMTYGIDAHSVDELVKGIKERDTLMSRFMM